MTPETLVITRRDIRPTTADEKPSALRRTTRVLLADDRATRRAALSAWLGADRAIELVAQVGRAEEAAGIIVDAQPPILVLVCDGPSHPFIALASRISRLSERTRVIVLSDEHHPRSCRAAAACGASAHLSLADHPEELSAAIRGRAGAHVARCVPLAADLAPPALSNRERDVLVHLAKGLSAKQTAAMLGICPKTVDNHAQRLMRKLDLHTRADVVRFAVREGYVAA